MRAHRRRFRSGSFLYHRAPNRQNSRMAASVHRCGAENNEKPTPRGRCDAYVKNMADVLREKIRPAGAQDGFALIF